MYYQGSGCIQSSFFHYGSIVKRKCQYAFTSIIDIVDDVRLTSMNKMSEECPHCGGRLIEKHEEVETERGKEIKFIFFRCVSCGKWTKIEQSSDTS